MADVPTRVIARLDIKAPNLVKGIHLEGLRVIGDPAEHAVRYYQQGADELVYIDIVASLYERNKSVFQELVLAAPDIDSRVFQSQVLPHIVHNTQHCTLYASSRDRALLMSRVFHNYQRLGETEPELGLGTPLAFDLGVFCVVIGVVLTMTLTLGEE